MAARRQALVVSLLLVCGLPPPVPAGAQLTDTTHTSHRFSGPLNLTDLGDHPSIGINSISKSSTASPERPSSSARPPSTTIRLVSTTEATTDTPALVVESADSSSAGRFEYIQVISTSSLPTPTQGRFTTSTPSKSVGLEPAMREGLQFLSGIYNPHEWHKLPNGLPVSPACRAQLNSYLAALDNGTTWAVQMTDASGRYSSQFFFGNDFWLGSHTLCEELGARYVPANPPWPVVFHVVQIAVHLDPVLTPTSRIISLGVCLPRSCDPKDITGILQAHADHSRSRSMGTGTGPSRAAMEVKRVRRVPGPYSLLSDFKMHILAGVSATMLILMLAGGVFEEMYRLQGGACGAARGRGAGGSKGSSDTERQGQQPPGHEQPRNKHSPQPPQPGVMVQIVMAFSPLSNGKKILNCAALDEDSLTAIHGLRFLSLAWVILVHTYLQVFAIAENKTLRTVTERNFLFQTVSNATFSVDTFFFISGLLVTFIYFKTAKKDTSSETKSLGPVTMKGKSKPDKKGSDFQRGFLKFIVLIGYRFIRLTPAYLFVLGLVEVSMRWVQNNSVFEPKILDQLNCDRYWWRNVLYINSLFPRKDMCMLWSWYMSNDTQFYVIGILLLLLSTRYLRLVAVALVALLVSSWITTATVAFQYGYLARIEDPFANFDEVYDKPWTRLGPYLVGMMTGWLLIRTNCRIRMSMPVVLVGWVLSLLCLVSLVYGLLHQKLGLAASAVYVSLGHTAWSIGLAWIVVACCTGYGGYINTLLSFRALYPLSRLTYCAYLLHPMIQVITSYQMDGPLHLHNNLVLTLYFGNVVASYLLSFVISLAFEAPVLRLLKIVIPPRKT